MVGGRGRATSEALGELARGAARHVGLAGRAVVDHLPVGDVPGRERRGVQQRRGEHARSCRPRSRRGRRRARRRRARRSRPPSAPTCRRTTCSPAASAASAWPRTTPGFVKSTSTSASVAASAASTDGEVGAAAGDAAGELEVVGRLDGRGERGAGPAGHARDQDSVHRRIMPRHTLRAVAKGEFTMIEAAGREVRLSNPGKVYFPRPGWTKLDLVEYYLDVRRGRDGPPARAPDGDEALRQRDHGGADLAEAGARRASRTGCRRRPSRSRPGAPPRSSSPTTPRTSCGRSTSA